MDQGVRYFERFLDAFPDVYSLAAAREESVLRVWQGLGYYSRARHLHAAAKEIVITQKGNFPQSYKEWLKVKGVGPYTAAAICSMAYGEPVPAIDGNVLRIVCRLFAIDLSIDTQAGKKACQQVVESLIDKNNPGAFNQAMMDFGSMVCKPLAPLCNQCMFNRECLAYGRKAVTKYPVRNKKKKSIDRHFHYFVYHYRDKQDRVCFLAKKRTEDDIWQNLFEWPMIETKFSHSDEPFIPEKGQLPFLPAFCKANPSGPAVVITHQLTHQRIKAFVYLYEIDPACARGLSFPFIVVNEETFDELPKPVMIEKVFRLIMGGWQP